MEKISLQKRDLTGKKARKLLNEDLLPGVIYNSKGESKNIQMSLSDAQKLINKATLTTIIDVNVDGKDTKTIIKEVDINPTTEELRHISFFEIDEKAPMVFEIPFEIIGISPAVKNSLGVLVQVLPALEVRCKVNDLVDSIKIDISGLEYPGQSIAVEDIKLPDGISLINEEVKNSPIVTITQLQKEEVIEKPEETEEGEEGEAAEGEETTEEGETVPAEESSESKEE
jgi:large subunit ribosomal protein L25